jgi:hypothetical protein
MVFRKAWLCYVHPMSEKIVKSYCNQCGRETNHTVLYIEETSKGILGQRYEMLKCRGCMEVSFRRVRTSKTEERAIVHYPPRIKRRRPKWIEYTKWIFDDNHHIPSAIWSIMEEVYVALENNSRRLAAMGIRAALEAVMIDKIGDQGTFNRNLDALQREHYLSLRQRDDLETILEAGHAAIHRGWRPSTEQINTLLDITESLIESIYVHGPSAERLEREVPKRPKPQGAG